MKETQVQPWVGKIAQRRKWLTHSSIVAWKSPMERGACWAAVQRVAINHCSSGKPSQSSLFPVTRSCNQGNLFYYFPWPFLKGTLDNVVHLLNMKLSQPTSFLYKVVGQKLFYIQKNLASLSTDSVLFLFFFFFFSVYIVLSFIGFQNI